ncbi:MAG: hypothetical protein HQM08_10055 [Candidatus Riflebacteria bacterium]|nr:hypothetical protein [Candidatus Riflebacteria bacterium]
MRQRSRGFALLMFIFLLGSVVNSVAVTNGINFVFERPVEVVANSSGIPDSQALPISGTNYSFRMDRVEVTSLDQLKQLLGVDKLPEDQWPKGAAGLIGAYQGSDANFTRMGITKYGRTPTVYLTDDQVISPTLQNSAKSAGVDLDTSLNSAYRIYGTDNINFCAGFFKNEPSTQIALEDGKYILTHEVTHLAENRIIQAGDYGQDNQHFWNETTGGSAPFTEAWAEYAEINQALTDGRQEYVDRWYPTLNEQSTYSQDATQMSKDDITGAQLLQVEGIECQALLEIQKKIPNGDAKIRQAYDATNTSTGTFQDFLKSFAASNPSDVDALKAILKEQTFGKLSDAEIANFIAGASGGSSPTGTVVIDGITYNTDNQGNRWYTRSDGVTVCFDKYGERWETTDGITWIDSTGLIWHTTDGRKTWNTTRDGTSWFDLNGNPVTLTPEELNKALSNTKYLVDKNSSLPVTDGVRNWMQNSDGNANVQTSQNTQTATSSNSSTGTITGTNTATNTGNGQKIENPDSE